MPPFGGWQALGALGPLFVFCASLSLECQGREHVMERTSISFFILSKALAGVLHSSQRELLNPRSDHVASLLKIVSLPVSHLIELRCMASRPFRVRALPCSAPSSLTAPLWLFSRAWWTLSAHPALV